MDSSMAENRGLNESKSEEESPSTPSQISNDAEGVWSPDIEQSFQEALAIYPPCGRRKIILSDEGKMYGRNELIARYIKLRTGKSRSRKQVSSHIQVLARRKARDIQANFKDQTSKDKALQAMATMSSAQIVSANPMQNKLGMPPGVESNAIAHQHQRIKTESHSSLSPQTQFWPPGSIPQGGVGGSPSLGFHYSPNSSHHYIGGINQQQQQQQQQQQHSSVIKQTVPQTSTIALSTSSLPTSPNQMQRTSYGGSASSSNLPVIAAGATGSWQNRQSDQGQMPLKFMEFSAYKEQQRIDQPDTYLKHLFVHLGPNANFADPNMEAIDIRQIYDKFPEKKGGLKELYEKGPSQLFFLVKFWGDLNTVDGEDTSAFYGVSSTYEAAENMTITCSTKVCSFGKQVVEKVETEYPRYENGRFIYQIHRSPMCEYMINFIHKLKHLPEKYMMNSVLENFTILQVVSNRDTQETLLCLAYVFEVSTSEHGAQHHIYRLVRGPNADA